MTLQWGRSLVLSQVIVFLLALLIAPVSLIAEEPTSAGEISDTLGAIQTNWYQVQQIIHSKDLHSLHELLNEIERLRNMGGFSALEEFSIALTEEGTRRYAAGDIEGADFFVRKARALSPDSAYVIIRSMPLARTVGVSSAWSDILHAIGRLPRSPAAIGKVISSIIYPTLWALTIALYLVFVLHCSFWCADILRSVAAHFPLHIRGVAAPIVTFSFLAIPIFMGPMACLVTWALLIWVCDRKKRWAPILSGILLAMWGVCIPLRERVMGWLSEPGMQAILALQGGSLGGLDRFEVESFARKNPRNGMAWYALSQLLRKEGNLTSANTALANAERIMGSTPWLKAEQGTILALQGNSLEASKKFEEAEAAGLATAELYFNWSKAKFEDFDTASVKEKLMQAEQVDPATTKMLRERESQIGLQHQSSFADMPMPTSLVLQALFAPRGIDGTPVSTQLMSGFSPGALVTVGIILVMFSVLPTNAKKRQRTAAYYAEYVPGSLLGTLPKLIPGGNWIITEKPLRAFLSFAIVALLSMPLIGWPMEAAFFQDFSEAITPYAIIVGVVAIGLSLSSVIFVEE